MYKNPPTLPDNKWPPTPSREYVKLAIVKKKDQRCRDDFIGHRLHGTILKDREEISVEQILEPGRRRHYILIEGAPGIGKSTFSLELCRKWETIPCMKKYRLVILLRLREKEVQKISNVSELFYSYGGEDKTRLVDEVSKSHGKGVLFILDGFDELPKRLQKEGFLISLILDRPLPECTVLVTSRPSATAELLTSVLPQKHIEIIQENKYASSVFSSEPETLERFKAYISASTNPVINNLMYVALNAAEIADIFRDSKPGHSLPHTLTEFNTQLCLSNLNRHLKIECPSMNVCKFEDLPLDLYQHFLKLCEVAFEGLKNEEVIFHTLPPDLVHFGFLDAVSALYGGGEVSYNFHFTLQEFFAAYHISQLSDDSGLVEMWRKGHNIIIDKLWRWNVVLRFVAGFKKCAELNHSNVSKGVLILNLLHIQCLFEAQIKEIDYKSIFRVKDFKTVSAWYNNSWTSLDKFALGYCISNSASNIGWIVDKNDKLSMDSFIDGLKTDTPCGGFIDNLDLHYSTDPYPLRELFSLIDIKRLRLFSFDSTNLIDILKLIPPHLKNLDIIRLCDLDYTSQNVLKISTSQPLTDDFFVSLKKLIDTGRFEKFVTDDQSLKDKKSILDMLFNNSAFKYLDLKMLNQREDNVIRSILSHLETNTCITELYVGGVRPGIIDAIARVIKCNSTLKHLKIWQISFPEESDDVRQIVNALQENTTLNDVKLTLSPRAGLLSSNIPTIYPEVTSDLPSYLNLKCEDYSSYMAANYPELTQDTRLSYILVT